MRILLAAVLWLHGLIHLMGTAKAFGWAELAALKHPIPAAFGVIWAVAAALFLATAAALFLWPRGWWWLAGAAIAVSMVAIAPSWSDAKAGALANAVVAVAALVAFLLDGPMSLRARYDDDATAALAAAAGTGVDRVVADADLAPLPAPLQRFLRVSGVVGQPRVRTVRLRMHGRIRSGPEAGWMPLVVQQITTLDPPVRLFYLDASMAGLPVPGYHRFADGHAMMLVKALGLVPVADDSGPAMTRSETVTFLNDLCLLAPGGLLTPAIRWDAIDDRQVRATFTLGAHTIGATLVFDADGRLADFWSDDRGRAEPGGTVAQGQRWSTPVSAYRAFGPFTLMAQAEALWHAPAGPYAYLELTLDDVAYNVATP